MADVFIVVRASFVEDFDEVRFVSGVEFRTSIVGAFADRESAMAAVEERMAADGREFVEMAFEHDVAVARFRSGSDGGRFRMRCGDVEFAVFRIGEDMPSAFMFGGRDSFSRG